MAKGKSLLTKTRVSAVAAVSQNAVSKQLPKVKALDQLKRSLRFESERAKQLFRLLVTSSSKKAKLISEFFRGLEERLAKSQLGVGYKDFGFDGWSSFAEFLRMGILGIRTKAGSAREFQSGMKGRKWWFIGKLLWERYVKYGPVRKELDAMAKDRLHDINKSITPSAPYMMADAWHKPGKPSLHPISDRFGPPLAGVEFLLETEEGVKEFLDFGHVAFNKKGYSTIPIPTEIKLVQAAKEVARQFGQFVPRLRSAKKLFVKFEKTDLEAVKAHVGSGIVGWKWDKVDGKILAEIDHRKLVFDPLARHQLVVKPARKEWGEVKRASASPRVDIGVGTTSQIVGGTKNQPEVDSFFHWTIEVAVSRTPFERIYQAVLGR